MQTIHNANIQEFVDNRLKETILQSIFTQLGQKLKHTRTIALSTFKSILFDELSPFHQIVLQYPVLNNFKRYFYFIW